MKEENNEIRDNNLMENYNKALQELYDHVGFVEDWVICPIDDCTDKYWDTDGQIVRFHENKENLYSEEGDYYQDDIYTQRFYKKHIYEGEIYIMIFCDPHVDGMHWFRIFDKNKRISRILQQGG